MSHYEEADEYCPHCDNQYVRGSRGACVLSSAPPRV
jgi:hypothetical protein